MPPCDCVSGIPHELWPWALVGGVLSGHCHWTCLARVVVGIGLIIGALWLLGKLYEGFRNWLKQLIREAVTEAPRYTEEDYLRDMIDVELGGRSYDIATRPRSSPRQSRSDDNQAH